MPGVKDEIGFQFVVVGAVVEVSQWCEVVPATTFTQLDIDGPHDETGAIELGTVQPEDGDRDARTPGNPSPVTCTPLLTGLIL